MNTFVKAIKETNKTTTHNGMRAKKSTKNDCVDLFFKAGAMRGQDILPSFETAFKEDSTIALKMIKTNYQVAGYEIPKIIFWNLNASDNVPVKFDKSGTALISGFSPAIMRAVLSNKLEDFTPMSVMMETLSNPRYEVL